LNSGGLTEFKMGHLPWGRALSGVVGLRRKRPGLLVLEGSDGMRTHQGAAVSGPTSKASPSPLPRSALLPLRFDRHEFAGSVGDIGVMIPLAVGVAVVAHLSLVTVFLCVATSYAATALVFRVPLPVQPMKVMGASIIALGLSASVVGAASLEIALLLLLLAFTPLARYLALLFPKAVLRGIQLSVGLLLLKGAITTASSGKALSGLHLSLGLGRVALPAGLLVALAVVVFLLVGNRQWHVPASLIVVGVGATVGALLAILGVSHVAAIPAGFSLPLRHLPSAGDAWVALYALVLPQIPLSLGNSVFATEDVMRHYFGGAARRVTARRLLLSLGLMNLVCGSVGGMSLCHGAGGATAHYRLGARSAGATLIAAALFAALAVGAAFGISPLFVPAAVLAGMLLFVGVEHCLLVADLKTLDEVVCALLIAALAMALNNLAIGFLVGWAVYMVALKRSPLQRMVLRWPRAIERLAPRPASLEQE
jgi:SulP family sulfate permease